MIDNNFKILSGTQFEGDMDGWYGPEGDRNVSSYDIKSVIQSKTGVELKKLGFMPNFHQIKTLRQNSTVKCTERNETDIPCNPLIEHCLFDIITDPCERNNIANQYPDILNTLLAKIENYRQSAVPARNKNRDFRGNPRFWDWTWTNFGDYLKDEL
uniref:CSON000252 protein n=1 Tax=Culicoides sonorensis TaxID=179676 RepID=A0A336MJN3_CULSO